MTTVVTFVLVGAVLAYSLLVLALIVKDYTIGLISGIAIFLVGISIAINNVDSINNVLTEGFALISIMLGLLIFINGSKEKIEELM